jgi:hypothetical protein
MNVLMRMLAWMAETAPEAPRSDASPTSTPPVQQLIARLRSAESSTEIRDASYALGVRAQNASEAERLRALDALESVAAKGQQASSLDFMPGAVGRIAKGSTALVQDRARQILGGWLLEWRNDNAAAALYHLRELGA